MDVLHRLAVHLRLRLGDEVIHLAHVRFDAKREIELVHDLLDIEQVAVVVVMRMIVVQVLAAGRFLDALPGDGHVRADDLIGLDCVGAEDDAGDADVIQARDDLLAVVKQLQQRRREHIARDAGGHVQKQSFHGKSLILIAQVVDHVGEITAAEAVVDIHDTDAAGAGVEHRQKRRDAAEGGAVAHAGGNGDHGAVGKAADDGGQRALHARDGDNHARGHDGLHVMQQTVHAGDADVVESGDPVAEGLRREGRFLRDRHIARAAGGDDDGAVPVRLGQLAEQADLREGVILQRVHLGNLVRRFLRDARDHDVLLPALAHGGHDADDVLVGLSRAVDHLGHALPQLAVVVDLGKAEILKRLKLQLRDGVVRRELAAADGFQYLNDAFLTHRGSLFSFIPACASCIPAWPLQTNPA